MQNLRYHHTGENLKDSELSKMTYIFSPLAKEKFDIARQNKQNLYIYGVTGVGKSAFIENVLRDTEYAYIDADKIYDNEVFVGLYSKGIDTVVIDNIQFVDDDEIKNNIINVVKDGRFWCILISRSTLPDWLVAYKFKAPGIAEIAQSDLILKRPQIVELLEEMDVVMAEEHIDQLTETSLGHAMTIKIAIEQYSKVLSEYGVVDDFWDKVIEPTKKTLWDYEECELFDKWDPWLSENIMRLSIVDRFDKELAESITGSSKVELLIQKATSIGNFLSIENDEYIIMQPVRMAMRRRLEKKYEKADRDELYYNAGRYYRKKGELIKALEMFEKSDNRRQIIDCLDETGGMNPGSSKLYELRHYYYQVESTGEITRPNIMAGLCMLYSLTMDVEKSEYWYETIKELEKDAKGDKKKILKSILLYLDIALPHRGSVDIATLIKSAMTLTLHREIKLIEFSVTGNAPSNMNGGKDFCSWSKLDNYYAQTIGDAVSFVLGEHGKGIVPLALAESYFEKGHDNYQVIRLSSKGHMQAEHGCIEECFVAEGIMAKIHLLEGNIDDARSVLASFKEKCIQNNARHLLPNINSILCELSMYAGNEGIYKEWLENEAPDEVNDYHVTERLRYLTKTKVYITLGKFESALALVERMIYYAEHYDRTYILIECEVLLSILQHRMGRDSWKETVQKAYTLAEEYGFVRILSLQGAALLELFEDTNITVKSEEFYTHVCNELTKMKGQYPDYLKSKEVVELSENGLAILRMQANGDSNDEIAKALCISVNTVKYHTKENCQRLGVRGRVAAVSEAIKRGIL